MKVSARITVLQPGWVLVTFQGEKPPLSSRPYWLRRSLADWARDQGKPIARTQPINHGGELLGLMAWTDKPETRQVPFLLHRSVKQPMEHLEALVQHAYRIYFKDTSGMNLAIVSRGGTAVVFDSAHTRILPFEKLRVDEKAKAAFAEWRTSGKSTYFVLQFPANSRPVDPSD